jgi:hypothetical protein
MNAELKLSEIEQQALAHGQELSQPTISRYRKQFFAHRESFSRAENESPTREGAYVDEISSMKGAYVDEISSMKGEYEHESSLHESESSRSDERRAVNE